MYFGVCRPAYRNVVDQNFYSNISTSFVIFFFQAEDGIRDGRVTGVQTCALPIWGKVNQPTVSHHLKLLAAANLVYVREEGRQHFYSLNQEYFTECCGRLMQRFAPDRKSVV